MLETARPIVRSFIDASPEDVPLNKVNLVRTLKKARGIPEDATLAVLDELAQKGMITMEDDVISQTEQEKRLVDWSFYVGRFHFRIKVGKKF